MADEKKPKLNIDLPELLADGEYANLSIITHSGQEFIFDFARLVPGRKSAKVKSRVVMTPQNAKQFSRLLADNLRRFESIHGSIPDRRTTDNDIPPINFGGPPKNV